MGEEILPRKSPAAVISRAYAATGHAAAPPSSVMNARRLMPNIGGSSNRLVSPSVGLPHAQHASERRLGPWGRPELF
jgi:hypothetical protein